MVWNHCLNCCIGFPEEYPVPYLPLPSVLVKVTFVPAVNFSVKSWVALKVIVFLLISLLGRFPCCVKLLADNLKDPVSDPPSKATEFIAVYPVSQMSFGVFLAATQGVACK